MWAVCLPWAISLHSHLSFSTFLLSKQPVIKNASKLAWRVCDAHCWSVALEWESWQTQAPFCSAMFWIFRMLLERSVASECSHVPPVILLHHCLILGIHQDEQFHGQAWDLDLPVLSLATAMDFVFSFITVTKSDWHAVGLCGTIHLKWHSYLNQTREMHKLVIKLLMRLTGNKKQIFFRIITHSMIEHERRWMHWVKMANQALRQTCTAKTRSLIHFPLSSAPSEPTRHTHTPPAWVSVTEKYVGGFLLHKESVTLTQA